VNQVQYVEPQEDHTFSLAFISVAVQLRIQVFLVISVYFNLRNILPKSGTFPPGHSVYVITVIFIYETVIFIYETCSLELYPSSPLR